MVDDHSLTIDEFCTAERICRATFYNLRRLSKGPREMRVASRIRISPEARAEWRRDREADAAAAE